MIINMHNTYAMLCSVIIVILPLKVIMTSNLGDRY